MPFHPIDPNDPKGDPKALWTTRAPLRPGETVSGWVCVLRAEKCTVGRGIDESAALADARTNLQRLAKGEGR